jgi:hypothetical protein
MPPTRTLGGVHEGPSAFSCPLSGSAIDSPPPLRRGGRRPGWCAGEAISVQQSAEWTSHEFPSSAEEGWPKARVVCWRSHQRSAFSCQRGGPAINSPPPVRRGGRRPGGVLVKPSAFSCQLSAEWTSHEFPSSGEEGWPKAGVVCRRSHQRSAFSSCQRSGPTINSPPPLRRGGRRPGWCHEKRSAVSYQRSEADTTP